MSGYFSFNEPLDLDTLVKLTQINYTIENWEEVLSLSDDLMALAKEVHKELVETESTTHIFKQHIIYYFGYSYLMTSLSYQKLGDYNKSREYISFYADLDWLNDQSETGKLIIQDFKFFASANEIQLDVLDGNKDKVPEYVQFLDENPEQVLQGLINILRSANQFNYRVDSDITKLSEHVENYIAYSGDKVRSAHYLSYQYQLALYKHKKQEHVAAIDIALHVLVASDLLNNDKFFKKAISLFEVIKKYGTVSQLKSCYDILNDIIMRGDLSNEKDHSFSSNPVGSVNRNYLS
ncbi:hypothetical protein M3231_03510 [Neobacillus mesonae]|nr:hypothetical protein [Neobacillus mesonae]